MSIRKRLTQEESRTVALEAARALLIELGPQAVTLKAVASRIGRTHANLLHHFGSASGLQKALASHLAANISGKIADAVFASRTGQGSSREVVELVFDAFNKEGAGALASWMLLTGNEDALDPIIEAVHDLVVEVHDFESDVLRETSLTLALMALGDALLGGPLSTSLELPRTAARDTAERLLLSAIQQARALAEAQPA